MKDKKKRRIELIVSLGVLLLFVTAMTVQLTVSRYAGKLPLFSNLPFFLLLNFNIFLLALVIFLFVRNITKITIEQKKGLLGGSLVKKMIFVSLVYSLFPSLCFFVPSIFIVIDRINGWFGSQIESSFKNVDMLQHQMVEARYREISNLIDELINNKGIKSVALLTKKLRKTVGEDGNIRVEPLTYDTVSSRLSMDPDKKWIWVKPFGKSAKALVVVSMTLPKSWQKNLKQSEELKEAYFNAKVLKSPIKAMYILLFTSIFFSVLFIATWGAFKLAHALMIPLRELSCGIKAVGVGDYDYKIDSEGDAELGVVVIAFNQMVKRLKDMQHQLWEKNKYLEVLLNNITSAVVGIDQKGGVISYNDSAKQYFRKDNDVKVGDLYRKAFDPKYVRVGHSLIREMRKDNSYSLCKSTELHVGSNLKNLFLYVSDIRSTNSTSLGFILVVIEDQTEMVKAHKMQIWQQAARKVAHEIKNPLTPIRLCAERLAKTIKPRARKEIGLLEECTTIIIKEVNELATLVDNFYAFARLPSLKLVKAHVNDLVLDMVSTYRAIYSEVLWQLELDSSMPLSSFDIEYVRRGMVNVIKNAVEAMDYPECKMKAVRVKTLYDDKLMLIKISIEDSGRGIPRAMAPFIGDLYFSTKNQGSGIGLSLVKNVVEYHKGYLNIYPGELGGTTVEMILPA